MTQHVEKKVVISGVGQSDVGRRLNRPALALTMDACLQAIADAGLERADIDGLATFPGPGSVMPGFSGPGIYEVQDVLRLNLDWYASGLEVSGQFGAIINACNAIGAGMARHVLVYRTITESSAQGQNGRASLSIDTMEVAPWTQWLIPFQAYSVVNLVALHAQRHMHDFGTTRQHLGALAVHARKMAGLNPRAIYREALTLDDYLSARPISSPLGLYDCDVPCDGSTAFVLSSSECSDDIPRPIHVEALGGASRVRPLWEQNLSLHETTIMSSAAHLWSRTDLKPQDVDVAELYDGFTFLALLWIEALICGLGNGPDFIGDGRRFALDGDLPLNTDGGQLSGGRLHGFGKLHSAVLQLRGEAGARQVNGPEVALASAGGAVGAGCILLTR